MPRKCIKMSDKAQYKRFNSTVFCALALFIMRRDLNRIACLEPCRPLAGTMSSPWSKLVHELQDCARNYVFKAAFKSYLSQGVASKIKTASRTCCWKLITWWKFTNWAPVSDRVSVMQPEKNTLVLRLLGKVTRSTVILYSAFYIHFKKQIILTAYEYGFLCE